MTFKKLITADQALNRIQANMAEAIAKIESGPQMSGVILKDVVLAGAAADTVIQHGLARTPVGFLVLYKSATGDVWNSATSNVRPDLEIILKAGAAMTVTLWVF